MYIILVKMADGEQFILTRKPKDNGAEIITFHDIYLIIHFVNQIIYSRGEGYYAFATYIAIVKLDMKILKAPDEPEDLLQYLKEDNIYELQNEDIPYVLYGVMVNKSILGLDTGINILEKRKTAGLNHRKQHLLPEK